MSIRPTTFPLSTTVPLSILQRKYFTQTHGDFSFNNSSDSMWLWIFVSLTACRGNPTSLFEDNGILGTGVESIFIGAWVEVLVAVEGSLEDCFSMNSLIKSSS